MIDLNPNAALYAAGVVNSRPGGDRRVRVDLGFFAGPRFEHPKAQLDCAAGFVRDNPDAPTEAVPLHLRMNGFRDVPEAGPRELAAWRTFGFVLRQLDALDAAEAAAAEAAKPKPEPPIWPGKQAYERRPGPFDPGGFTAG